VPTPPSRHLTVLVAVLTLATLELIRSSGPLLDMAFRQGVATVAAAALVTYLTPALLAPVLVIVGRRVGLGLLGPVVVGAVALGAARLVVQGTTAGARFGVGLATVALAIAVLTLAVGALAARSGGPSAARAVGLGLAGAIGLQLALDTWDAYWRHDILGWGVAVLLVAVLVTTAWTTKGETANDAGSLRAPDGGASAPRAHIGRLWALGPVLGLSAMVLANPAFAASQTSVPLAVAGPLLGAAWLLTAWPRATAGSFMAPMTLATALVLGGLTTALMVGVGVSALIVLLAVPLLTCDVLGNALKPRVGVQMGAARAAGVAALVGLGTILPLLIYQLDYEIPLGVPNYLVLVAAAVAIGTAGVHRVRTVATKATDQPVPASDQPIAASEEQVPASDQPIPVAAPASIAESDRSAQTPTPFTASDRSAPVWAPTPVARPTRPLGQMTAPVAAAAILLLGGTLLAGIRTIAAAGESTLVTEQVTLVSWNLHYGVDPAGAVDLEQIAQTIEAQNPSVVLLQEVSRGWVMGGGADEATWLAYRLGMRMSFAPAADRQFGNAILTSLPLDNVTMLRLPYGEGPQRRSALSADLLVAGGPLRVTSVHTQHSDENTATRLDQIRTLLATEGDEPTAIIAGDFNAEPGSPEIELLTDGTGYVSAVDSSAAPGTLTSPSTDPQQRIDWVFGRSVTFLDARVLDDALSSDHLPIVVTLRTGSATEEE
jgi:endonuclease/exonuclease/phosphatase family metal-dependent hydrolase